MMGNGFEFEWAGATQIRTVGALEVKVDPALLARLTPGAFTFADGTKQGWSLEQMYDADTEPPTLIQSMGTIPPQLSAGFTLSNHYGLGLAATTKYLIGPKSATYLGFAFVSPDVTGRQGWSASTGYRLDLYRDYFCWFNNPKYHQVQLQAEFMDKQGAPVYLAELDASTGGPAYHDIAHSQNYDLNWTAAEFSDAGLTLRRVRIFCKLLNVAAVAGIDLASGSSGSWLIGNVRPLH